MKTSSVTSCLFLLLAILLLGLGSIFILPKAQPCRTPAW